MPSKDNVTAKAAIKPLYHTSDWHNLATCSYRRQTH